MVKIIQKFIPTTFKDTRPGTRMTPKWITIHETDNTNKGADAEAHSRLQANGNSRQASWHFTVDDKISYQSLPLNEAGWHAGDGNGPGNKTSIGIEICVNSDGDYKKAVENAAELTRSLMSQLNIPITNVVQHNHWSGKNCPRNLRSGSKGIGWNDFINLVKSDIKTEVAKANNKISFYTGGYSGDSLVKIHSFLIQKGYWFIPKRIDGGSLSFEIGQFTKGDEKAKEMEQFLKNINAWYQIK
ncbi:N-acetylmuramoyl-L-alanine amidase [Heyndrickxia sp. FSL W8-0496]|uniref:peptidoglycan recognition protein family protein n=1 Tax=Heyndrickxia sp. FSL W8-0496 TaxID=2954702 RepID=UPI0030FBEDD1